MKCHSTGVPRRRHVQQSSSSRINPAAQLLGRRDRTSGGAGETNEGAGQAYLLEARTLPDKWLPLRTSSPCSQCRSRSLFLSADRRRAHLPKPRQSRATRTRSEQPLGSGSRCRLRGAGRRVASPVMWKKRSAAFFRLVQCTVNRPPWQAATGGTRHGQEYLGSCASAGA